MTLRLWMGIALTIPLAAGFGCGKPDGESGDGQDLTVNAASDLGPNDVSILWPIADGEWNGDDGKPLSKGYLKLFPSAGEQGPAFASREIYDASFPSLASDKTSDEIRDALTVVSVRATPCAASHVEGECVPQLRLVAQPLLPGSPSVHVLYRLAEDEFSRLVADLATWRSHSPVPTGDRLSIHPGLKSAGVDSEFAHELTSIVLRYATEGALTRITFNAFRRTDPIGWTFSQFDRDGSGWKPSPIPGLPAGTQSQVLHWPALLPEPAAARDFSTLIAAASPEGRGEAITSPKMLAARDAVLAYENPNLTNAETVDCAGCHSASAARGVGSYLGMSFATNAAYATPSWMNPSIEQSDLSKDMVAFGYGQPAEGFPGVKPSIATRVVNDTADALSRIRGARH